MDARTGEFAVFDSAGEASLVDAVGASCAVPGLWPPVTIAERRFMDGGMRTVANADLAHGYERVVIVAPVAAGIGFMASPRRQAAALTATGARVALVRPDRAAVRAIGRNVLDVSTIPAIPGSRGRLRSATRSVPQLGRGRLRPAPLHPGLTSYRKGYLSESPAMAGFVCAACTAFMPGSNWRTCAR